MSNFGPEIASAVISLEVDLANQQINAAAAKAAAQFNKTFAQTQATLNARSKSSQAAAAASVAAAFGGISKQLDFVIPKLSAFEKISKAVATTTSKFGTAMTGAAVATGALTAVVVGLGVAFVRTAGNFQELEQSINAIIENSSTAGTSTDAFIKSLRELALQSGRSSEQLANTGRQFLALGFSGRETLEVLEAFTKAAALTGASSRQLELALNGVSQIASKGVVSMEELRRQIAENLPGAVNLSRFFELLGENMGITTEEARKLQEQGKITADVGIKTLIQTVNEATEGLDVFALRAQTLNGLLGILKEGFTQAVQSGFRPFVDALTQATSGPLGKLVQGLQSGGGAIEGFSGLIERFGTVLGTSFRDILNEILPLIPQLANLFVTLTEAIAPVVVDLIRTGATITKFVVPALTVAAEGLRILFTELGPVSFILRQLATGALITGAVRAFSLFGRAAGSLGGLIGRIATPITKILDTFSKMAGPIGAVTASFGLLRNLLGPLANSVEFLKISIGALAIAFVSLKIGAITNLLFAFNSATVAVGLGVQRLVASVRTASIALTTLGRALAIAGPAVAASIAFNALAGSIQRANEQSKNLQQSLTEGIEPDSIESLRNAVNDTSSELTRQKGVVEGYTGSVTGFFKRMGEFGTGAKNIYLDAAQAVNDLDPVLAQLQARLGLGEAVIASVANATGASVNQIQNAIRALGIDITNIPVAKELAVTKRIIDSIKDAALGAGSGLSNLNKALQEAVDKQDDIARANKTVKDAEKTLLGSRKDLVSATEDLKDAEKELVTAKQRLIDTTTELNQLEAERLVLLKDTARDLREIGDAQRDLERIGIRLLGIDEERADILQQISELQNEDLSDEKAAADNRVTRATIAHNRALREQQELLAGLNEEQQSSIDLSNLTLDQLRGRLAGLRLEANAQRAKKKTGKSQVEIDEEIALAGIDVLETQGELNDAIEDRLGLDNKVIENQVEIKRLNGILKGLELDKADLIDDQVEAQIALIALQNGETTRLGEIKKIDGEIATLRTQIKTDTEGIEKANANIKTSQEAIRDASIIIKDNEILVRDAKLQQRSTVALILGDENLINEALRARIGMNNTLVGQSSNILANSLIANLLPTLAPIDQVLFEATVGANKNDPAFAQKLADIILNNPNKLRTLFRALGISGFEQGGMITSPTMAVMGERFKHEMVLPMTKPDRVWSLLSQNLPKYPGAMRAAQDAISPSASIPSISKLVSSGNRVQKRSDGPATFGQIQELIEAIRSYEPSFKVDAPISISGNGIDEDALVKKLAKKLERDVLTRLSRR